MFEFEEGSPVGLLGINFDDSRYRELCGGLLSAIHPKDFSGGECRTCQESTAESRKGVWPQKRFLPLA